MQIHGTSSTTKDLGPQIMKRLKSTSVKLTLTQNFKYQDYEDDKAIEFAFARQMADERNSWLNTNVDEEFVDHSKFQVSCRDFVNNELIGFSRAICI